MESDKKILTNPEDLKVIELDLPDTELAALPVEPTMKMVMAGEDAMDAAMMNRLIAKPRLAWPSEEIVPLVARVVYQAMISEYIKSTKCK